MLSRLVSRRRVRGLRGGQVPVEIGGSADCSLFPLLRGARDLDVEILTYLSVP